MVYNKFCIIWNYPPKKEKEKENTKFSIMVITDVKIRKTFEEGPMKAVASVTFDGEIALHDVKVIFAKEKYFVVMPSRKNPDGTYRDIVHPITADARERLERSVIGAYFDYLKSAETAAVETV